MWPTGVLAWVNSSRHQQLIRHPWGTSPSCEGSQEEADPCQRVHVGPTWVKCGLPGYQVATGSDWENLTIKRWWVCDIGQIKSEILSRKSDLTPATAGHRRHVMLASQRATFSDSVTRKLHLLATEERWEKNSNQRLYGRAAFHLSLMITYLVGTVKSHHTCTYTRTRTHRHTWSLQHAEPGYRAFFHPSFCHHSTWLGLVASVLQPEQAILSSIKQTNKQTNAKHTIRNGTKPLICVRKTGRLRWEAAQKLMEGATIGTACIQNVSAHTLHTGGIIWWHRCVVEKSRCLTLPSTILHSPECELRSSGPVWLCLSTSMMYQ